MEADPAYKAAINGTVPPDRFVQKFVIGAPRDQLGVMAKAFENFESMRTNLARIARSNADGNVKAAAGVIRSALEDIPLRPGAEHAGDQME